ncbi:MULTISPECIES: hypothetical protein [Pantoea]|uniref:hypothetical protein n=1 Tax=Pantoea TaxID=53335 RepID=UPI0012E0BE7C|nr:MULTISPECIES: hypothetical protein [Pantoea]
MLNFSKRHGYCCKILAKLASLIKSGFMAGNSVVQPDNCERVQPISTFSQTVSEITVTPVLNPLCAPRLSGRIPRRWEMTDALTKKSARFAPFRLAGSWRFLWDIK